MSNGTYRLHGKRFAVSIVVLTTLAWGRAASAQATLQDMLRQSVDSIGTGQTVIFRGYTVNGHFFSTYHAASAYIDRLRFGLGVDSILGSGPSNFNYGQQLGTGVSVGGILNNIQRNTFACGQRNGATYEVPQGRYSGERLIRVAQHGLGSIAVPRSWSIVVGDDAFVSVTSGWSFEPGGMLTLSWTPRKMEWSQGRAGNKNWCEVVGRYQYTGPHGVFAFRPVGDDAECRFSPSTCQPNGDGCNAPFAATCASRAPEFCSPPADQWSTNGQIRLGAANTAAPVMRYPDGSTETFVSYTGTGLPQTPFNAGETSITAALFGDLPLPGPHHWFTSQSTDRNGNQTQFTYDANGWVSQVRDPKGRTTAYTRDAASRIVRIDAPGPNGTTLATNLAWSEHQFNVEAEFGPNFCAVPSGSTPGGYVPCPAVAMVTLDSMTLPDGRAYTFQYGNFGNLTQVIAPDGAKTVFTYGGNSTVTQWPTNYPTNRCPADGQTGGLHRTEHLLKRRLIATTVYPDGTGSGHATSIEHEPPQVLQPKDAPGVCTRILWRKETFPDGSFKRIGTCSELTLDINRCVTANDNDILHCVTPHGSLNEYVFAEEHGDAAGNILERTDYGDWATMRPFAEWEQKLEALPEPGKSYNSGTSPSRVRGTYLDIRPTKSIHRRDGLTYIKQYTYEPSTQPALDGRMRTLGNIASTTLLDSGQNTISIDRIQYHHSDALDARHLIRLPLSESVSGAGNVVVKQTDYRYDESSLTASGAPNLDGSIGAARGNITSVISYLDPVGKQGPITTQTSYYDTGDVRRNIDPRGNATTTTYDGFAACAAARTRVQMTVTNALDQATSTVTDCNTEVPLRITDANGARTCMQYDAFGRIAATVEPGDSISTVAGLVTDPGCTGGAGGPTTWIERPAPATPQRWKLVHTKDGTTDGQLKKTFTDGMEREVQTCTEVDPAVHEHAWVCDRTTYDAMGRKSDMSTPFYADTVGTTAVEVPTGMQVMRTQYDALARKTSTALVGSDDQIFYRTLTSYGTATYTALDGASATGWQATVTDPNDHVAKTVTDLLGHIVETRRQGTGCTAGFCVTKLKPNALGWVTKIEDAAGNVTTVLFDGLGRKVELNDPDMGRWTYQRDANGNVIRRVDAKNQVTVMQYDALDRLTLEDVPPLGLGVEDVVTTYDGALPTSCRSCDDHCASTTDTCHTATLTCTHTGTECDPPAAACSSCQTLGSNGMCKSNDALSTGMELQAGQSIRSCDNRFTLIMQSDGNLVIYGPGTMGAIWATATNGPGRHVALQSDGNLVVIGPSGALWSSGTAGNPGASLVMQNDGNLVIYSAQGPALWSSDTARSCGDNFCDPTAPENSNNCPQDCCADGSVPVTCWPDGDGDGFGAGAAVRRCGCTQGFAANNGDCYDGNANAKPGQTACFTQPRGSDGSFDYNCSGSASRCSGPTTYAAGCGSCTSTCTISAAVTSAQCGLFVPTGCAPPSCGPSGGACSFVAQSYQWVGCQ